YHLSDRSKLRLCNWFIDSRLQLVCGSWFECWYRACHRRADIQKIDSAPGPHQVHDFRHIPGKNRIPESYLRRGDVDRLGEPWEGGQQNDPCEQERTIEPHDLFSFHGCATDVRLSRP